jgi:hypothetical protein
MPSIKIEESAFATLWYHPDKKIVHHQFHKFISGDKFRSFLMKGTETMRKNKANKWLSDDRKNPVLKSEDLAWGQTTWFPETLFVGWKYWAIVKPEFVLAQMSMEDLVKTYSQAGIIAQFFSNPDEAMKWLESQP